MTTLARSERAALVELFEAVGPDAPTLCEGWATRDLAAHLILREGSLIASAGIAVKPLAGYTRRYQENLAKDPWPKLVERIRNGPPRWSMMSLDVVDTNANGLEYFIHHEDVRRARDGWTVRTLPAEHQDFAWSVIEKRAKRFLGSTPVGVVLRRSDDGRSVVANDAQPQVTVVGTPLEIALFAYGRQASADVTLEGDPEAVKALTEASLGL